MEVVRSAPITVVPRYVAHQERVLRIHPQTNNEFYIYHSPNMTPICTRLFPVQEYSTIKWSQPRSVHTTTSFKQAKIKKIEAKIRYDLPMFNICGYETYKIEYVVHYGHPSQTNDFAEYLDDVGKKFHETGIDVECITQKIGRSGVSIGLNICFGANDMKIISIDNF
jgi:hypothetical protein